MNDSISFADALSRALPSTLPSEFYASVITASSPIYSNTFTTLTNLTTSTVTVYIGPNTTQTLYYPEPC
ncbi:MAG: hypothetical protein ACHQ1H_08850 [Nitrososphaerales archaeon]